MDEIEQSLQGMAYAKMGEDSKPTHRQSLSAKKARLESQLANINAAISALDAHPDLEQFIATLGRAGV